MAKLIPCVYGHSSDCLMFRTKDRKCNALCAKSINSDGDCSFYKSKDDMTAAEITAYWTGSEFGFVPDPKGVPDGLLHK